MEHCVISGNTAGYNGGGVYAGQVSYLYMDSCIVRNNYAGSYGGGVGHWANNRSWITNTVIENNSALIKGGGVFLYINSMADLTGCDIRGNSTTTASSYGGGVSTYSAASLNLTRCLIVDNSSNLAGGGIYRESGTALSITNCTVAGNTTAADSGAGIHTKYGDIPMTNTIVWGNSPTEVVQSGGTLTSSYCCINDAAADTGSSNNIITDPQFVDAANGDYHLQEGSPCSDAGDPATQDPDMTRADIGALYIPQNTWWGTIDQATFWTKAESPYRIVGDLTVSYCSLTVEAGVEVLFDADAQIYVYDGKISAWGTETDSVIFAPGAASEWGGIRLYDSDSCVFHFTRISGGHADLPGSGLLGGAVYAQGLASFGMFDCVLRDNIANQSGGAVCFQTDGVMAGRGRLERCRLYNNTANGGVTKGGGAIAHVGEHSVVYIVDCEIFNNSAPNQNGGAVAMTDISSGDIVMERCRIYGNSAYNEGGALYVKDNCGLTMSRCQVYGNYNQGNGGGLTARSMATPVQISNCTFYNNVAGGNGTRSIPTPATSR